MSNTRAARRRQERANARDERDAGRLARALSADRLDEAAALLRRRPDIAKELAVAHRAADGESTAQATEGIEVFTPWPSPEGGTTDPSPVGPADALESDAGPRG